MKGKFIMIASSKGGVGKSTAALGISRALRDRGNKVLLVDLDFGNACLDMLLGVQDSVLYTIQDVALGRAAVENVPIKIEEKPPVKRRKKAEIAQEGELWLLPSAAGGIGCVPSMGGESILGDFSVCCIVTNACELLKADFVVIDTGAGVNSAVYAAATLADTALVVTGQTPVALRSAQTTVSRLSQLEIDDIRLIVNSFDAEGVIEDDRKGLFAVIDESRAVLGGVVPYDYSLLLSHERSSVGGGEGDIAFSNIAERLLGNSVPLFRGIKRMRRLKKKICL